MNNKSGADKKIAWLILAILTTVFVFGVLFEKNSIDQKRQAALKLQQHIELRQRVEKEKEEEHDLLVQYSRLIKLPTCHYALGVMNNEYKRIHTALADIRNRRNRYNRSDSDHRIVGYTLEQIEEELQMYNSKIASGQSSNLISKKEDEE